MRHTVRPVGGKSHKPLGLGNPLRDKSQPNEEKKSIIYIEKKKYIYYYT